MDDEQQIISDILDNLYGHESVLKEDDSEVIKAKSKEKDEKSKEIVTQINNICEELTNELKKIIGPDIGEMKKTIRLQVLTTIKAEIDNKNNIIDSDGKISVGKTFDIIKQSKNEILENIQAEKDTVNYKKEDENIISEDSKEDEVLNNFFEQLEDAGVELSQDEKDLMAEAIARVNEIMKIIKEKVDSGMSKTEAMKSILSGMSREEIELLRAQFVLAGQCKLLESLLEEEKEGRKDSPESEEKDEKEDSSKRNTERYTHSYEESTKSNSILPLPSSYEFDSFFDVFDEVYQEYIKEPGGEDGNIKHPNAFATTGVSQQILDTINMTQKLKATIVKKKQVLPEIRRENDNRLSSSEEQLEGIMASFTEMQQEHLAYVTSFMTETTIEQAKNVSPIVHEMGHTTVEKRTNDEGVRRKEMAGTMGNKISDENFTPYFEGQNELLTVSLPKENQHTDISMLGKFGGHDALHGMRDDYTAIIAETVSVTPPPVSTSTTPPAPTPASIVEEMTVDDSGVTQGAQSEPSKKGTLNVSDIMALVERQAEVRKMLEANGIIHGQMPEGPTAENRETQGAPATDNEKSGGEPGEH